MGHHCCSYGTCRYRTLYSYSYTYEYIGRRNSRTCKTATNYDRLRYCTWLEWDRGGIGALLIPILVRAVLNSSAALLLYTRPIYSEPHHQ